MNEASRQTPAADLNVISVQFFTCPWGRPGEVTCDYFWLPVMSTVFNAIYFADISYWLICPWGSHTSYYFPRAFTPTLRPILKCTFSGGVVPFFLQHICTHKSLSQIDERSLLTAAFCLAQRYFIFLLCLEIMVLLLLQLQNCTTRFGVIATSAMMRSRGFCAQAVLWHWNIKGGGMSISGAVCTPR